jgi:hypothetical protein
MQLRSADEGATVFYKVGRRSSDLEYDPELTSGYCISTIT